MKSSIPLNVIRVIAFILLLAGAIDSVYRTLQTGRNNASFILPALFVSWVLSPFVALLLADIASKRWAVFTPFALYGLMVACSIGSLVGYSGMLSPPNAKPAGIFLIVPLLSWLLIAIVALFSRRLSRKNDSL